MQLSFFDADKIEQSPDCISAYDDGLTILIWNKACEKKYGLLHLFPHIRKDYRVACFRKCAQEEESFFFPNLPLLYGVGIYSQVILPLHNEEDEIIGSLNIIREGEHKRIKKEHLIQPLCGIKEL